MLSTVLKALQWLAQLLRLGWALNGFEEAVLSIFKKISNAKI